MKYIYVMPEDFGSNSYIVYDEKTLEGFVIDCGTSGDKILKIARQNNIKPQAQLLTHGHFDHCTDAKMLQNKGFLIYMMQEDAAAMNFGFPFEKFSPDKILIKGKLILCGIEIEVIATSGHSKGSCCFIIENLLFSGDTLFANGGYGRYDLPGGNYYELTASLKKIFNLSGDYILLPGHGEFSSLDAERKNCFFEKTLE